MLSIWQDLVSSSTSFRTTRLLTSKKLPVDALALRHGSGETTSEVEFRILRQSVQDAVGVRLQTETPPADADEQLADDLEHSDVPPDSPSMSEAPRGNLP